MGDTPFQSMDRKNTLSDIKPLEVYVMTVTIENRHGALVVHEGKKLPKSRLEWRASGLEVYLKGSFSKVYDQAANLAMNYALSIHIPAISLRRVSK